jgi:Glycosyl hydrolases family 28
VCYAASGFARTLRPIIGSSHFLVILRRPCFPPSPNDPQHGRPRMIILVNCRQVLLRDFTIHDAPTWSIHPISCQDLLIDGASIHNNMLVPNCDGIDIDRCRNVRVANCDIHAGDDGIILKSSRNFPQYGICENVTVTNCVLRSSSAAIKIEPEGPGIVRNAVFDNCVIAPSNRGICIFNRDGAKIENLIFSNFAVATELRTNMWWEPANPSTSPTSRATAKPSPAPSAICASIIFSAAAKAVHSSSADQTVQWKTWTLTIQNYDRKNFGHPRRLLRSPPQRSSPWGFTNTPSPASTPKT